MIRPITRLMAVALITPAVGSCAGGGALPALPDLPGPNEPSRLPGRVTDVYVRVARGATACWFGADGALKGNYIFHAEVDPPSKGEVAKIEIHEIDRSQPSPWGKRVFRIQLVPVDGATSIAVDNLSMEEDIARRMRADVFAWTEGKSACSTKEVLSPATTAANALLPKNRPSALARSAASAARTY